MRPTQSDLLDCITASLEQYIAPEVTGAMAGSQLLTIQYLLHQLGLRVQHEAPALAAFELDAREALGAVKDRLREPGWARVNGVLDDALTGAVPSGPQAYAAASLEERTTRLRVCLDDVLKALGSAAGDDSEDAAAVEARQILLRCVGRQLDREAMWLQSGYSAPRR